MMKLWALGAALVLVAAAGCTSSKKGNTSGDVSGQIKPRQITWLNARPSDGPVIQAVREVAADYAKLHRGFSLNMVTTPDRPSYLQKVETLAAANKLPELFDEDATPFAASLRKQARLLNVANLLNDFGLTSRFRPLALDYQRFDDGGLYAVPLELHMEYFWYNKAAFAKARIKPPTTLDDLAASCGPLREAGYTPIAVDGQDGWPLERYLAFVPFRLTANDFVNKLKKTDAKLSDAPGKAATDFVAKLGSNKCFEDGFSSAGYTDAMSLFTTGKAAMINIGTWELANLAGPKAPAQMRESLAYFKVPTTADATTTENEYVVSSGIGMAINARTFDPLVKDFLKYLLEHYPAKYAALGQISPTTGVQATIPQGSTPLYSQVLAEADKLGAHTAKPWDTLLDPTSNTKVQQDLVLLAQGNMSPDKFESDVDSTIAANAPRYFPK